jgi:spore coat polysaccharide biosynthesis protein SpsF
MGSTRLPGKVLKDIGGKTMLARVVNRLRQASFLDQVVVATTDRSADDAIVDECKRMEVAVFRGSEQDVLDRYFQAAQAHQSEAVVRISADCPLIDPEVVDQVVGVFRQEKPDYASNTLQRTFPRGLDTEVMTFASLQRAWQQACLPYQRVHVTPYIYQNRGFFRLRRVINERDLSCHRWTVDTAEDLELIRAIYGGFVGSESFRWTEILTLLDQHPDWFELNKHIRQKALVEG